MKTKSAFSRLFATAAIGFAIASYGSGSAFAAENSAPQTMRQEWMKRHEEMQAEHLKKMAAHIGITASQDAAWQAYTAVLMTRPTPAAHPDATADAATIARFHADMAAEHAKRLASLADATSKLQASLSVEQRKKFDEIAHHMMAMHEHGRWHHGWHHHHHGDWHHGWHHDSHADHTSAPAN